MGILRFKSGEDGGGAAVGYLRSPPDAFVDDEVGQVAHNRARCYLLQNPTPQKLVPLEIVPRGLRFFPLHCCRMKGIDADTRIGPR